MKGGFHYFTRSQRIAIVALLVVIGVVVVLDLTMRHWAPAPPSFIDTTFVAEVKAFEEEMERARQEQHKGWQHHSYAHEYVERHRHGKEESVEEFDFDPNELDSVGFVRLGLRPWMASNILKYRARGGQFRKKEDFLKIYGVDSLTYLRLKPYIQLPEVVMEEKGIPDIMVELNTADTTILFELVKHSVAKGVIGYRRTLGGYADIEQLKEVYGMTDEQYAILSTHAEIDASKIQKVKVNSASVEYLKRHPYINFYQAKAIYELRVAMRRLNTIDDLKALEEFTPTDIERITPYLSFE